MNFKLVKKLEKIGFRIEQDGPDHTIIGVGTEAQLEILQDYAPSIEIEDGKITFYVTSAVPANPDAWNGIMIMGEEVEELLGGSLDTFLANAEKIYSLIGKLVSSACELLEK